MNTGHHWRMKKQHIMMPRLVPHWTRFMFAQVSRSQERSQRYYDDKSESPGFSRSINLVSVMVR